MNVTEIQRFCMHDGPGIRTVVFLKGCPLRCKWCHNPETQSTKNEILFYPNKCIGCGACTEVCPNGSHRITDTDHIFNRNLCTACMRCTQVCCSKALTASHTEMTVAELVDEIKRDVAFYGENGGVTISGGEPLMNPRETLALLYVCKKQGIKTAIETCGFFDSSFIPELVPLTDCFLWDFKDGNTERHRKYTGVSNESIIENLLIADSFGAETVMRCIMVKGVNMNEEHYNSIADLWNKLKHCKYVELMPYHAYGGSKMAALGKSDNGNRKWVPDKALLQEVRDFLHNRNVILK